jgi:hypothetical protein
VYRIWTYQEAVLAHNPLAICGSSSIAWGQLALIIVFLSEMKHSPLIEQWLELLYNRAMLEKGSGPDEPTLTELTSYRKSCRSLLEISGRISSLLYLHLILAAGLGFILAMVGAALISVQSGISTILALLLFVSFITILIAARFM